MLEFEKIQYIVNKTEGKGINYSITTNGIKLKDEKILNFLIAYNFKLNISFDGVNNNYRKNIKNENTTNQVIDILKKIKDDNLNYLKEKVTLAVTITPPFNLLENEKYFSKEFFSEFQYSISMILDGNLKIYDGLDIEREAKKLDDDFNLLMELYLNGKSNNFIDALVGKSLYRIENRDNSIRKNRYTYGACDFGKMRLYVTSDGKLRICERVNNNGEIGDINKNKYASIDLKNKFFSEILYRCKDCWAVRLCELCFASFSRVDYEIDNICENEKKWLEKMIAIYIEKSA